MIRNKIVTMRHLAAHGVPIPATYVSADREALVPLLEQGPLIVKPFMGSRGIGVQRVTTREELFVTADDTPPIFAQRFHPSDDGLDHKISVIGGTVFGVKQYFLFAPTRTRQGHLSRLMTRRARSRTGYRKRSQQICLPST